MSQGGGPLLLALALTRGAACALARRSPVWRGWDLGLYYFFHYDDFPALSRSISVGAVGPEVRITPEYERTHLVGTSGSNTFGDLTLRSEVAYSTSRLLALDDPNDADGLADRATLAYMVGLDWSGLNETLISGQLFQNWVTRDARRLRRERLETSLSLLVRRELLNDSLVASVLAIHSLNGGDGLVRARLQYEFSDPLVGWIELAWFYGSKRGLFGQFDGRDRLLLGLEWGFGGSG